MMLPDAIGTVGPAASTAATIHARLNDLHQHSDALRMPARGSIPGRCIDGRPSHTSDIPAFPRAAGGTLTAWAAYALATPSPLSNENALLTGLDRMAEYLQLHAHAVGDHRGEAPQPTLSGCGAADNLRTILAMIANRPATLSRMLASWGVPWAASAQLIADNAHALSRGALPTGTDVLRTIESHTPTPVPTLRGAHREIGVMANGKPGTTFDDDAIHLALRDASQGQGPAQVFVVDTWAFDPLAEVLVAYCDEYSHAHYAAAAAAFNAATVLTLCAPTMPTVFFD